MEKGIVSIKDLLKKDGSYLSFQEIKGKFSCKTNFLQYFQIISAIPDRLRLKARQMESANKQFFTSKIILFISTKISRSTLIKPNQETSIIFSSLKPTLEIRRVLKDGAKYFL